MDKEIFRKITSRERKEIYGRLSIAEVMDQRCRERSDRPALWQNVNGVWKAIFWKDYWDQVKKLAKIMEKRGLEIGDRVAVILPTSLEWDLIEKAAMCQGLVVVGLDPRMGFDEMVRLIKESEAKAVFVADRVMVERLRAKQGEAGFPVFKWNVCLERCSDLYEPFEDWTTLEREMAGAMGMQTVFPATAESPASYILTSGTTGTPKGIVYTQGQLLLAAQSILAAMGPFGKDDRTVAWLPMASPFQRNMNLAALLAGVPIYFQGDPQQLPKTLREVRPTVMIGVPRVYEKIYLAILEKLSGLPLGLGCMVKGVLKGAMGLTPRSSKEQAAMGWVRRTVLRWARQLCRPLANPLGGQMRMMVTGSAPCREDVLVFFHALGIPLLEAYGVSECAVPISMNRPNDYKIGTVGRPLASNNLNVEGGEIEVDGPAVFGGYENQSMQTNLTSGKYLSTGDVGVMDGEGYLRLVGRKGDMIKTSTGRKIAPAAIERKLVEEVGAQQAMVIGNGRAYLVAIVCVEGGLKGSEREAFEARLNKMNEKLAAYERVGGYVVLDRLFSVERGELTSSMKLRRTEIELIHWEVIKSVYEQKNGKTCRLHSSL